MKVLFPIDLATYNPTNPFVVQLMEALIRNPAISCIGHGYSSFYWRKPRWDIVHIQWPEALVGWRAPNKSQLSDLHDALTWYKRHSSIVLTVHNYEPHAEFGPAGKELFELVFAHCDAFVHLGEASRSWFVNRYSKEPWCARATHSIIEHGDFRYYKTLKSNKHSIPSAAGAHRLYLVFGTIRSVAEESFATQAFQLANLSSAKLVLAGAISPEVKEYHKTIANSLDSPAIIRRQHHIPAENVKPLFRSSHFVFIPRSGRLNSGVIPLAFTFGIPVIGPSDGVIGEIIRETGNISFTVGDVRSASEALSRGHSLTQDEYVAMVRRIRKYARKRMDWAVIASQHVALYSNIRTMGLRFRSMLGLR